MKKSAQSFGRREFFKTTAAVTGTAIFAKPGTAFGTAANSTLNLGLLGCGGRGTSVAGDFITHNNVQVSALGDLFQDRIDAARNTLEKQQRDKGRSKVSKEFVGPDCVEQICNSDVDIILIATPPYFHPEHLEIALDAGKHVYLEKPVATDVHGCVKIMELASKAEGKMSVDVGFQIRNGSHFAEQTRRLHEGAIGDITCVHGFYFAGDLPRRDPLGPSAGEAKLRNWYFYRALAGDILVEQNIHVIDVYNWIMKTHPLRAEATAARKVRTDIGDVSDHYIVTYYYPNDVRASFMSTQFLPQWGTVGWRVFGPKGFSEAFYSGGLRIVGENSWVAGSDGTASDAAPEIDPLGDATPLKTQAFVNSIISGKYHNQLKQGAESTLSAILGRQAAYEGQSLSWGQLLASDQHWEIDFNVTEL
jgi:predicted dehydrogenase